jgi:hypothetical protein
MTAVDDEANRRHLAALTGGPDTRWREHIERDPKVLGVQWDKLPPSFRQKWWKASDCGQHPPPPEFMARIPELLAVEQAKLDADKREAVAATARAHEVLRHRRRLRLELFAKRLWRRSAKPVVDLWWRLRQRGPYAPPGRTRRRQTQAGRLTFPDGSDRAHVQ